MAKLCGTFTGIMKCGGKTRHYAGGGGLSAKDRGSDKKPYPSVKGSDFAGGGRSYPIPTRADAVDALRLAGLHGRSDVRAKVYRKYPDLKKSKKMQEGGMILKQPEIKFDMWYAKTALKKNLDPNPNSPLHYYDYKGYYDKYGDIDMTEKEHFTDEFKLPGHPTFSNESKYSNEQTPGGSWNKTDDDAFIFEHSPFTNNYYNRTAKYLEGSGEYHSLPGIRVTPKNKGILINK